MAPVDNVRLPFRWQFIPFQSEESGSILWRWEAYSQTGDLVMLSSWFDSFTECQQNARLAGYQTPSEPEDS